MKRQQSVSHPPGNSRHASSAHSFPVFLSEIYLNQDNHLRIVDAKWQQLAATIFGFLDDAYFTAMMA
jgi:hypothetical protein